ncbi:small acid-soluble spore protein, alpha/beta type [Alkaliphilus metalliredigens QYMF]|uniref:Small acid-soluble spore protein, alpha/beta type n=1 Tax=Alkaliphilus metalliredigens (strain QYMF) TaxID=293826 RepID=A6TMJ1_ALKMQ|nr:alpha/beta-type small acid-soluble spore protein [Alkaliphilus metalliredigens]ABR47409.1 small acid-soluble spore protein, alpha/beta type [Alkaliphilus metalliredigens QYMF]
MRRQKSPVIPEAREALLSFKEEIAQELGLENQTKAGYVGGHMVKKMVEEAEKSLTHLGRS